MESMISVHKQYKNFILLRPGSYPARTGNTYQQIVSESDLPAVLEMAGASRVLAVDFETKGGDYSRYPEEHIVGMGLAWDTGSIYVDWACLSDQTINTVLNFLLDHKGLVAHNVYFDGGWIRQMTGHHPAWHVCTYGLYKQLANEGFIGQTWGLKNAMVDLLGWVDTNETELDEWLVANGYHKQNKAPDKSNMWRAPSAILGKYCILDAEATYLLFTEVLEPVYIQYPDLVHHHTVDYMYSVKKHIEQKIHGILMDRDKLHKHNDYLISTIDSLLSQFRDHPEVAIHIKEWEDAKYREFLTTEPNQYKKFEPVTEPAKYTKSGDLSKNWLKWSERSKVGPEVSKNWLNWKEKNKAILDRQNEDYIFNLRSGLQLRWLFYERLGLVPVSFTESGKPSIDGSSLGTYDKDYLEPFLAASELIKEQSYIQDYVNLTNDRPTIHSSYRMPGTLTGRLSSTTPNQQQAPKKKAVMECFIARPGHKWVDLDFCLHPDTEYLTRRGWLTVDRLSPEDEVWQVNPDTREGSWCTPSRIIRREYDGPMYSIGNTRGRYLATENHRVLWTNPLSYPTYYHKTTLSQEGVPSRGRSTLLTSSESNIEGYKASFEELDMACLLQADSYLDPRSGKSGKYAIQVSRARKIERITNLLGPPYKTTVPRGKQKMEVSHWAGVDYSSPLLRGKSLYLEELDSSLAPQLVECLSFWDGHVRSTGQIRYVSTDYETVDQIQRYLVRCGYECRIAKSIDPKNKHYKLVYRLSIQKQKGFQVSGITSEHYSGPVGCVTVDTGYILIRSEGQTFVTGNCALEPHCTAELSGCPRMEAIFGEGRPDNDVYLFIGAHIEGLKEGILATGYDPYNPTPEGLAKAKKECKKARSICKVVHLSCSYGAGPGKIQQTLSISNIHLSLEEVTSIHKMYWDLFKSVKKYNYKLQEEWKRNKGWVYNGLGRPMAVDELLVRDVMNRVIQSTGHGILTLYIRLVSEELDRQKIPWNPVILDWHDATTVEVPEEYAKQTARILEWAVEEVNKTLDWKIKHSGVAVIGNNLADVKEPEA